MSVPQDVSISISGAEHPTARTGGGDDPRNLMEHVVTVESVRVMSHEVNHTSFSFNTVTDRWPWEKPHCFVETVVVRNHMAW